jgi:hypothetical protein
MRLCWLWAPASTVTAWRSPNPESADAQRGASVAQFRFPWPQTPGSRKESLAFLRPKRQPLMEGSRAGSSVALPSGQFDVFDVLDVDGKGPIFP